MIGKDEEQVNWLKIADHDLLEIGEVTTVTANHEQICISRTKDGYGAICNSCPHQGGPLGEGFLETLDDGQKYVICPWHAYEYHFQSGEAPPGFNDVSSPFRIEERDDGIYVAVPKKEEKITIMDQLVDTMIEWGVKVVFGMVGHSNLGLAESLYKAQRDGRLDYFGIRHEGAAAFAASGFAKVTGKPAACFSIAGPGATNLLTGLWDAKVDRVPIIALTGQIDTKYLGPHNFQEIPTKEAFEAVTEFSQEVIRRDNASELMALAIKSAILNRDVSHLIFPDEVQTLSGIDDHQVPHKSGRLASNKIIPSSELCNQAVELIDNANSPAIIIGNGVRQSKSAKLVVELAEKIDAPIITTFKAKGIINEKHPLATGVLGRSGTPVSSSVMGKSDVLIVFGASFSKHTGISAAKKIIQVDFDREQLGRFHPVTLPIWGEIGTTLRKLLDSVTTKERPGRRAYVKTRWDKWRETKKQRSNRLDSEGRIMNATIFAELSNVVPDEVVISVDVGNNTYSFGRYFESKTHDLIMSGYLGSIGFGFPAAMGAWAAYNGEKKVMVVVGDGGFGQYAMEFTTAVKYDMNITVILLNNSELGKITKEQQNSGSHVFGTSLVNPNFAEFAKNCGGMGIRVTKPEKLSEAFKQAISNEGPSLVEIISTSDPK